jgi:hypothetical protein
VPTPNYVIAEILSKARVGRKTFCTISAPATAHRHRGRKTDGLPRRGLRIDADLVDDSRKAAVRAGVQERVRFIEADIFTADFSEATVVTIYMGGMSIASSARGCFETQAGHADRFLLFRHGGMETRRRLNLRQGGAYFWIIPANASVSGTERRARGEREPMGAHGRQSFQEFSGEVLYREGDTR